jgi:hypothetical protein
MLLEIIQAITWIGKGVVSIKDWIEQKIKLIDATEQAVKDDFPKVIQVIDDAEQLAKVTMGTVGADLDALRVLCAAMEAAAAGGSIPTEAIEVATNPAVQAAALAVAQIIFAGKTYTPIFAALGTLLADVDACGVAVEASLKTIEADA